MSVTKEDNFEGYLRSQNISKFVLLRDLFVEFFLPKQRHSGAREIRKTFRAMHRSHPQEQPGCLQERVAFASRSKLNKHTSNLLLFANTYCKSSTQSRRILSCMDVLLRTRGTIRSGVRGVFDVIREIKM